MARLRWDRVVKENQERKQGFEYLGGQPGPDKGDKDALVEEWRYHCCPTVAKQTVVKMTCDGCFRRITCAELKNHQFCVRYGKEAREFRCTACGKRFDAEGARRHFAIP